MGMDVGKVNIEYLERPSGIAYEFIKHLAENAGCSGEGNAFGFYSKDQVNRTAMEFIAKVKADPEHVEHLRTWIDSIPWNEDDYMVLNFNW